MRKIPYIILLFTVLFTALSTLSLRAQVGYSDVRITRSGEYVAVSFEVTAGQKSVKRGESLILTPVLFNDKHNVTLPSVAVQSRRSELQEFRAGGGSAERSGGQLASPATRAYTPEHSALPDAPVHIIRNGRQDGTAGTPQPPAYTTRPGGKILYSTRIPYTEVLSNLFLRIERREQRCGRAFTLSAITLTDRAALEFVPPALFIPQSRPLADYALSLPITSVADSLARHYPFVAPMEEFERNKRASSNRLFDPNMPLNMGKGQSGSQQDAVESFIVSNEKGAMQINFERGSTQILRHYQENNRSLVNLASVLKAIQGSGNSAVKRIIIAGFASPEGPLERNDRLAWGRAGSTLEFIRANSTVALPNIQLYNGSEDWWGLREMVAQSDIEAKYEMLYIIDNVPILDGREKQLMEVAGGRPYKFMVRYFFPRLRNAAYIKVYYDNPPAVTAAAQDIEQAWALIHKEEYRAALELLEAHTALSGGGVENLMGVCCMMLHDYDRARAYLRQAVAKGNTEAGENLKRITEA